MDYYIELCLAQNKRYLEFLNSHPEWSEQTCRQYFFATSREIEISHTITNGISSWKSYQDLQRN